MSTADEIPEGDAIDQRIPALSEDDSADADSRTRQSPTPDASGSLEADPADVADQERTVPVPDDELPPEAG